jgi:hypothetical protein
MPTYYPAHHLILPKHPFDHSFLSLRRPHGALRRHGADSALKRRLREGGRAPQQARDQRILLYSHRIQLRRRRFEARCTGSSYGAEAVEFESVERPKKTVIELKEMANADHGPQRHHPRCARPRPRSGCPGAARARSLPVLHPPTSYARRASSAPLVGEPRRATPPLLRHRPVSRAVCPSLDSPVDEQWGSVSPSTHQPTTLAVAAVVGAGARGSA